MSGLGQNVLALNRERGATWREVHNVYLQYAVDLGVPGLALFLWLFVALFRAAGRVRRHGVADPAFRDVGIVAGSVQVALVAFAVAAILSSGRLPVLLLLHRRSGARGQERLPSHSRVVSSDAAVGVNEHHRTDRTDPSPEDPADAALRRH